jgi:hypothetical protein
MEQVRVTRKFCVSFQNCAESHKDYSVFMNSVIRNISLNIACVELIFLVQDDRRDTMNKIKFTLIAAVIAALSIAAPAAAFAQSAYTTGSAAGNAAAGYPSPYGNGYGFYNYAPGNGFAHQHTRHDR